MKEYKEYYVTLKESGLFGGGRTLATVKIIGLSDEELCRLQNKICNRKFEEYDEFYNHGLKSIAWCTTESGQSCKGSDPGRHTLLFREVKKRSLKDQREIDKELKSKDCNHAILKTCQQLALDISNERSTSPEVTAPSPVEGGNCDTPPAVSTGQDSDETSNADIPDTSDRDHWLYSQCQNIEMSHKVIAKKYQECFGESVSVTSVARRAEQYQQRHFPDNPLPERPKGRKNGQ